jgi:hypothetical protein
MLSPLVITAVLSLFFGMYGIAKAGMVATSRLEQS